MEQCAPEFRIIHEFPSASDESAWRDCLSRCDWPTHYASPEFFAEPFWAGKRPFAVLAYEAGRVIAVLTGLHEGRSIVSGNYWRPQICFDRTTSVSRAAEILTRGVLAERGSEDLVSIFAWTQFNSLRKMGFRIRQSSVGNVILDLSRGPEFLFANLHPNRRRNVRYAMKQGVEIFQATSPADSWSYYEVYQRWRQTSRKAIYGDLTPFSVMEEAHQLRGNRVVLLARYKGRVIAGDVLRFCAGGLVEASSNSSLDEFLRLKPNDLLVWKAIEWACEAGFTRMNLCGASHFLREFGGKVVPTYRHRRDGTWLRQHDLHEITVDTCKNFLGRAPLLDKIVRRLLGKTSG
jgi:hypothetical protein